MTDQTQVYILNHDDWEVHSSLLTTDELKRFQSLPNNKKKSYGVSRSALRFLLKNYLGEEPQIYYNSDGKPLADGVYFNLSHSGNHTVIAISGQSQVGVDIEWVRPRRFSTIMKKHYSCSEREYCGQERIDQSRFYRIWCRKEAYLKYIGKGLHFPLWQWDVSSPGPFHPALNAYVFDVPINRRYCAALALSNHTWPKITQLSFDNLFSRFQ